MSKPAITTKVVLSQQLQYVFISTFLLFTLIFTVNANAACQREDVAFYLTKGFNHEQIITLCDTPNTPQPSVAPITRKSPSIPQHQQSLSHTAKPTTHNDQTQFGLYAHPDAVFLATAVESYDVEVTDNAVIFSSKDCFDFGVEDNNGFRNRACPNVRYSIARGGLKIIERDNGLFGFGSTALYIAGNVTANILDLDVFRTENQAMIQAVVDKRTQKLKINVRSGMPQSKVEAILLKLAG